VAHRIKVDAKGAILRGLVVGARARPAATIAGSAVAMSGTEKSMWILLRVAAARHVGCTQSSIRWKASVVRPSGCPGSARHRVAQGW